jgi:hypothetical protein
MGKDRLANLTDEELRGKLKTFKTLQATTASQFAMSNGLRSELRKREDTSRNIDKS